MAGSAGEVKGSIPLECGSLFSSPTFKRLYSLACTMCMWSVLQDVRGNTCTVYARSSRNVMGLMYVTTDTQTCSAAATGGKTPCFPCIRNNASPRASLAKIRYPEEREKQRRTLMVDPEATSWRHALEPPSAPHQTNNTPPDALSGRPVPPTLAVDGGKHDSSAMSEAAAAAVGEDADGKLLRSSAADLNISVANNDSPACSAETSASVRAVPTEIEGCNQDGDQAGPSEAEAIKSEDCGILEEKEDGKQGGELFVCNVVPLSLALGQLGLAAVDLLKVDVEGDELAVLRGINDEDWPKIHQARRWLGNLYFMNYQMVSVAHHSSFLSEHIHVQGSTQWKNRCCPQCVLVASFFSRLFPVKRVCSLLS